MSWDRSKYEAKCDHCGKEGFCIRGSNDWGGTSTDWEGFDNVPPNAYEVGRKKAGPLDHQPRCKCGKGEIVLGKYLGECDIQGKLYKAKGDKS